MKVSTSVFIDKPKEDVWKVVTDIENCADRITSIIRVDILENPNDSLVGLKWRETRNMFGKEASEIMWVTESVDSAYYVTRAESHGSIYISRIEVESKDEGTLLTMTFIGEAQTWMAKILSAVMSVMIKGSIKKELDKDLQDIKRYLSK